MRSEYCCWQAGSMTLGHAENNVEQILFRKNTFSDAATDSIGSGPSCTLTLSSSGPEVKIFFKIIFLSWAFPWKSHLSSKSHLFLKHFRAKSTAQPASTKTVGRGAPRKQVIFFTSIGNIGYNRRNTNSPFSQNVGRSSEHFEGASEHLRAGGGSGKLDIF